MAQFEYQRRDSAEELLSGWMSELESVLYCSEVEEAIKEVKTRVESRGSKFMPIFSCL